jgi:hypothetical protein
VEKKKLQQPMTNGEEFFQEFFEKIHVSNIILQRQDQKQEPW